MHRCHRCRFGWEHRRPAPAAHPVTHVDNTHCTLIARRARAPASGCCQIASQAVAAPSLPSSAPAPAPAPPIVHARGGGETACPCGRPRRVCVCCQAALAPIVSRSVLLQGDDDNCVRLRTRLSPATGVAACRAAACMQCQLNNQSAGTWSCYRVSVYRLPAGSNGRAPKSFKSL